MHANLVNILHVILSPEPVEGRRIPWFHGILPLRLTSLCPEFTEGFAQGQNDRRGLRCSRGQSLTEFVLVLPLLVMLILTAVEVAFTGIRSFVAEHAAMRAARVAEVYQRDYADMELFAMLPPSLFRGGFVDEESGEDVVRINAIASPLVNVRSLNPALLIKRESPSVTALPRGLSDALLQGGDTPSPYCKNGEGYKTCGYPE